LACGGDGGGDGAGFLRLLLARLAGLWLSEKSEFKWIW